MCWLNAQYHGRRFDSLRRWNTSLKAVTGLAASATFVAAVSKFGDIGMHALIAASLTAAICSVVQVSLGLDQIMNQYTQARSMYLSLFSRIETLIKDIRRRGTMSDEQVGAAKLLLSWYSGLATMDAPREDDQLTKELTAKMEETFPVTEDAWLRF